MTQTLSQHAKAGRPGITGYATAPMDLDVEKRELANALTASLATADRLGLALTGIYISQAIDALGLAEGWNQNPPSKPS